MFEPFSVETYEAYSRQERGAPFAFPLGQPLAPFELIEPFGLRKAVVPVFCREPNGEIFGMGTAFHVDGWGGFLTADHVIDFMREAQPQRSLNQPKMVKLNPADTPHAILFLGLGLIYGQVRIPEWAFAPVQNLRTTVVENLDPFVSLRGGAPWRVGADIAALHVNINPQVTASHSLAVKAVRWQPRIGEYVLAVGYPQLDCTQVAENTIRTLVAEGMQGAYGRITNIFPEGRGSANPGPVFEVEADWRSGMSGGPVFNHLGQVVAVVNRSLAPDGDARGVGYATYLSGISTVSQLMPSLDYSNPGWRQGFGVLGRFPRTLAGVFRTQEEAFRFASAAGQDHDVVPGSHQLGSDNFIKDRVHMPRTT
jgi:serine protease Do